MLQRFDLHHPPLTNVRNKKPHEIPLFLPNLVVKVTCYSYCETQDCPVVPSVDKVILSFIYLCIHQRIFLGNFLCVKTSDEISF